MADHTVSARGGDAIEVAGSFTPAEALEVQLGTVGGAGAPCYSGIPGSGYVLRSTDGAVLPVVLPPAVASILALWARPISGGSWVAIASVQVVEYAFPEKHHDIRRVFPPWYELGPRSLAGEPDQEFVISTSSGQTYGTGTFGSATYGG